MVKHQWQTWTLNLRVFGVHKKNKNKKIKEQYHISKKSDKYFFKDNSFI